MYIFMMDHTWLPRRELNPHLLVQSQALLPLNYEAMNWSRVMELNHRQPPRGGRSNVELTREWSARKELNLLLDLIRVA